MRNRSLMLAAALVVTGCVTKTKLDPLEGVSSFVVTVNGVYQKGTKNLVPVATPCSTKYGGDDKVPADVRGTPDCRYQIPHGEVDVEVKLNALNTKGDAAPLDGTVSFKAVPGDLTSDYNYRYAYMQGGELTATTRASHLYGEVRVWAEDAPPPYVYDAGTEVPYTVQDGTRQRTYATGVSPVIYFEEPTLAKIQIPDGFDNRSSPFVGQFMTVGRNPEGSNDPGLIQSCPDLGPDGKAQPQDGQPVTMVVTGMDPGGFFVTDLTACRVKEQIYDGTTQRVRVSEPDGYLPGTFASLYVYNYSFPDGLDQGDLIWTLSGSVQEFTSTTQLTFPAWSIREKVRQLPTDQWNKYLDQVKPYEINHRTCGIDNQPAPFLTDSLCGHSKYNLKMESLESGLVKIRNVRFPETFANCDKNGDGTVPFYCEGKLPDGTWAWQDCDFNSTTPGPDAAEMQCNIDCVIGQGDWANKRCSEKSTYDGFGQFVVEMQPPGPASAGMDPTMPSKISEIVLSGTSQLSSLQFTGSADVSLFCEADARFKVGDDTVVATEADQPIKAGQQLNLKLGAADSRVAMIASGTPAAGSKCYVSWNPRAKINLVTRDAIPELHPDCSVDDPNGDVAQQCKYTLGATYDVVGHLRHLQPGRPRWAIIPRDADDVCCHPGPGLQCPKPLKACQ
ncbi:MAG: hypothetical protein ACJ790_14440 [Myxococcaceae bacterium]